MSYDHENPKTWPNFHPLIIAHDVGHTRTAQPRSSAATAPFHRGDLASSISENFRSVFTAAHGPANLPRSIAITTTMP